MPRRADDPQLTAGRLDHVPVAQTLGAEPVGRIGGPDRRAGQLGQPPGPGRMVVVAVGQQDLGDPPARAARRTRRR